MSQALTTFGPSDLTRVIEAVITAPEEEESQRIYRSDLQHLFHWMSERGVGYNGMDEEGAALYKAHLKQAFARATAQRMLTVARLLFSKLKQRGALADNPFVEVKNFSLDNESTHIALTEDQAQALLDAIDRETPIGLRDYAVILLLLRTGIRRAECAALNIGDLSMEQGHHIAIIQHGKGDKRRRVKIPVDVFRVLAAYIGTSGRAITSLDDPLFIGFDRRPTYANTRISPKAIERIVTYYGVVIGFTPPHTLTPHDLRTTFITLAREGGATLEQRQYAAGHADPRTTQRYDRRKINLDENAVDKIHLRAKD